ncbi:glutathione S-transferase family protein [Pseudomonas sp. NA-150]|uniref:glutathione S-transferase family protein n=1 Tax=Pseudomonas sp. NA-150 TaxID=3367525 RepID=UPI0037C9DBCB
MSTSTMKIYQAVGSPNSRRVRIFIAEKGIDIPTINLDLSTKEQFSDTYSAINSRNVVPTLVLEDGTSIGEVPAICRYLEEMYPEPLLLGSTAKQKVLIGMWDRRMEQEGFAAVMDAVRNSLAGMKGRALTGPHFYDQIPAMVDRSKVRVTNFYTDLDKRLSESPFTAGNEFSIADITTICTIDFATRALQMPFPQTLTAIKRWYDLVESRPSASL